MVIEVLIGSIVCIAIGVLILIRNPNDIAKNTPLDYVGFGIMAIGGIPVWIGFALVFLVILFIAMEYHDANF